MFLFFLLPEFVYDVLHHQESKEEVHLRKEGQNKRQRWREEKGKESRGDISGESLEATPDLNQPMLFLSDPVLAFVKSQRLLNI